MVIATSTGEVYESEDHQAIGETMPNVPQITVRPHSTAAEETQSTPPIQSEYGVLKEAERGMEMPVVGQHPQFDVDRYGRSAQRWDGQNPEVFAPESNLQEFDTSKHELLKPIEFKEPRKYGPDKITAEEFKTKEFAEKARYIGAMAYEDLKKLGQGLVDGLTQGPKLLEKMAKGEIDPHSDEAIKELSEIALNFGMGGIATSPLRPKGSVGMFGGKLGIETAAYAEKNPAAKESFQQAAKELNDGIDPTKVYEKYGVFEGPDGKLRFEISDKGARLKTENLVVKEDKITMPDWKAAGTSVPERGVHYETPYAKEVIPIGETTDQWLARLKDPSLQKRVGPRTFGDIVDHPELYKYYPDVAKIELAPSPWYDFMGGIRGFHNPEKNQINIRGSDEKGMLSTALHEAQHAIQHREGFARGGNVEEHLPKTEVFTKVKEMTGQLADVNYKHWQTIEPEIKDYVKKFKVEANEEWKKRAELSKQGKINWREVGISRDIEPANWWNIQNVAERIVSGKPAGEGAVNLWEFIKTAHPAFAENLLVLTQAKHTLNTIETEAHVLYRQLWGEYEARVTQARQAFDQSERRAAPHWKSEEFAKTYPESTVPFEALKFDTKP